MEISEKSKKNEILDAYQELLKKVQNTKEVSHQEVQQKQQEEELVIKAAKFDVEHIVSSLGQVKVMIAQSIGVLEKRLVEEYTRLSELQEASRIESKNLEELHQIKKNADSLAALLLAQKGRKADFEEEMLEQQHALEQEMTAKRVEWQIEQERQSKAQTEYEAEIKRKRIREEEEYRYSFMHERKKEKDSYETQKNSLERELEERRISLEKEWSEREAILVETEEEILGLRDRVAQFPDELKQAIEAAAKDARESLERDYRYKIDLKAAEIEGEKKLQHQTILSLQARIKEQEILIRDLSQKAEIASQQVQSIALKALEGATGINRVEENKKMQQQ